MAIAFNFFGTGGTGEYGLAQTLTSTLQANTQYTLEVDVGNIASGIAVDNTSYNLNGFPGARLDLLAGGTILHQTLITPGSIPEGQFATRSVTFTTGATHALLGQALTIRLVNLNVVDPTAPNADLEVDFDNVRLGTVAIPEPSTTLLLLSSGALALGLRRLVRIHRRPPPA